ncbi:MAG: VTT domain-containing protein [Mycoplasmataceae bacterium]|jgi:uncharacterized membrane protein YdjX (TVP38/TMEM64 family)|nr:VTT domain-containing protein [Mycoplasmataceae bacterium]
MDIEFIYQWNDILKAVIFKIGDFGILGAIAMALAEALFPSLPLIAIAGINVMNFGILGYFLTYIGSTLGTIIVFLVIRHLLSNWFLNSKIYQKNKIINKFINWIEKAEIAKIFILFCLPFLPTFLLNYACALSKMKVKRFIYLILCSRAVAIIMFSYMGSSLLDIINHPFKGLISVIFLIIIYIVSKIVEKQITKKDA